MDSSCVACLDQNSTVKLVPCNHVPYCSNCYAKFRLINLQDDSWECPLCRTSVKHVFGPFAKDIFGKCPAFQPSHEAFVEIAKRIRTLRGPWDSNPGAYGCFLHDIQEIMQGIPFGSFASLSEVEAMLTNAQNNQICTKIVPSLLVSMCNEPWNVAAALGSYGVCYHGNLGDAPSLEPGFRVLKRNAKELRDGMPY